MWKHITFFIHQPEREMNCYIKDSDDTGVYSTVLLMGEKHIILQSNRNPLCTVQTQRSESPVQRTAVQQVQRPVYCPVSLICSDLRLIQQQRTVAFKAAADTEVNQSLSLLVLSTVVLLKVWGGPHRWETKT